MALKITHVTKGCVHQIHTKRCLCAAAGVRKVATIPRTATLLATFSLLLADCGAFSTGCLPSLSALASKFPPLAARSLRKSPLASSLRMSDHAAAIKALNPSWQQTMLRVKDYKKSLSFYQDTMGMTLIDILRFPEFKFDLYFLATLPKDEPYTLTPGTDEAHKYLWSMKGTTMELTHNYGTEDDASQKYHPGNGEKDGFGHVAFNCDDVYAACDKLEKAGYTFKKKPDEGRMKGLAFVYDPDGYWVEIIKRGEKSGIKEEFNLSQTMLRIKDPKKSLPFYEALGMTLVRERHFEEAKFSLYFLQSCVPEGAFKADPKTDEANDYVKNLYGPILELTHNHGTENDPEFAHKTGNEADSKGFGHIGFICDDVMKTCEALKGMGAEFVKEPMGGNMKGLAFAKDPDGYWIEVIKRGGYDDKATPYWLEPEQK